MYTLATGETVLHTANQGDAIATLAKALGRLPCEHPQCSDVATTITEYTEYPPGIHKQSESLNEAELTCKAHTGWRVNRAAAGGGTVTDQQVSATFDGDTWNIASNTYGGRYHLARGQYRLPANWQDPAPQKGHKFWRPPSAAVELLRPDQDEREELPKPGRQFRSEEWDDLFGGDQGMRVWIVTSDDTLIAKDSFLGYELHDNLPNQWQYHIDEHRWDGRTLTLNVTDKSAWAGRKLLRRHRHTVTLAPASHKASAALMKLSAGLQPPRRPSYILASLNTDARELAMTALGNSDINGNTAAAIAAAISQWISTQPSQQARQVAAALLSNGVTSPEDVRHLLHVAAETG